MRKSNDVKQSKGPLKHSNICKKKKTLKIKISGFTVSVSDRERCKRESEGERRGWDNEL